jgi:dienelactone hydrolase/ribosome-associated toxin RatA of RatAB toxin-antitoxin module
MSGPASSIVNAVVIDGSVERVYHACTDVERWPEIFASCRAVEQTVVGPDEVLMEMTVSNELGSNTVQSRRRYDPARQRIEFTMLTPPPSVATMEGSWTVEPVPGGARVVVVHDFVPHDSTEAAVADLQTVLYQTTERAMADLKEWIEAGTGRPGADTTSAAAVDDGWRPLYEDMRTSPKLVSARTFEVCELFFSRLGLCGLDWGDLSMVMKDLKKANTHEDWADWHQRWSALGSHYEERADEAFAAGFRETGRFAIGRAAACYHFAEFFYFDAPEIKSTTRARVTAAFDRGLPYLRENVRPLRIPFGGRQLPGYLMTPPGPGPWPCVILINGLDSAKEVELWAFARPFLARGMAVVVFDGPGQGLLAGHTPMVIEFERVVAAVLAEAGRQPEVDADRVGVCGVSFGGYLAPRAAATVPGIRACISLSGGFDHDNYADLNVMVQKDFKYVFGIEDDVAMAELCRTRLNLRNTPRLQVPLLSVHPEVDKIIPFESCLRMQDWAAGETELLRYSGERHVAPEHFADYIPRFCDWMAERLDAVSP